MSRQRNNPICQCRPWVVCRCHEWRPTKTATRRRFLTTGTYRWIAEIAGKTSLRNASRVCGVATSTVRRAMKMFNVPIRRQGNLTKTEIENIKTNGWAA